MILPDYFKRKVKTAFGEKGIIWLDEILEITTKCFKKWKITEYKIADNLSYNLILFVESEIYGSSVLKVCTPHKEEYSEIRALELFKSGSVCKIYDYDLDLGSFMIERVSPGNDLKSLECQNTQLETVSELISSLPVEISKEDTFPSYSDWIKRAFKKAKTENRVHHDMFFHIQKAEEYFLEIEKLNRPEVLLHGDLHHTNILKNGDEWKVIDPKGVIGIACMESARFMDNHLDFTEEENRVDCFYEMISIFSRKFSESERTIAVCLYLLRVLSSCWSFEENISEEEAKESVDNCSFVYDRLVEMGNKLI